MCTYIYTRHNDCSHKQYQNTFKCPSARGSALLQSPWNLTLEHTIHLPDQAPKQIPHALCDGQIKKAIRPVPGRCRTCIREDREMKQLLARRVLMMNNVIEGARQVRDGTNTATGVRTSILGLQKLVEATKPLDLEE
ncbi:uncharacterized protein CTRU02_203354 [Colletotrichum truncatum]|uniref:Uncharacterized protein n=1 Tax=Colletotrichum truncatum TaxID=5467 RepID=A0ACC3Z914_COLTU|nr:uncharacterized protein CTRU02_05740 [Colletotrichum truncatum]KAF6793485.1 hypothetical protein CTRU02_05740 [Colletotrichum truncatum]